MIRYSANQGAAPASESFLETALNWLKTTGVSIGIKIVLSLVIMFISFKLINIITRRIEKSGNKKNRDKTISKTLAHILRIAAKCLVTVAIISFLGIDTSGITALIASFGVCIGLAVNGTVANFAGGIMIILTRPFKIDDYIEAQGYSGTVTDINMTNTKLCTPDNKTVYIPNGTLSNDTIINYSEKDLRRVDLTFSIAYSNDFEKAKDIILNLAENHELVLKDPKPFVRVGAHSSSSIDITTKLWVKNQDYWTVNHDMLENVKSEFDRQGIEIPFNQLDVHVHKD